MFLVQIINPKYPLAQQEDFIEAKQNEIDGLHARKICTKVKRNEIPPKASIIGGRFVLTLNNFLTPEEMCKARYVAQGYSDAFKELLAHDGTALRPISIGIILCIATILSFRIFSHEVTQWLSSS